MVLTYERAREEDLERVIRFYYDLIDDMEQTQEPYRPRWQKGVYPDEELLRNAVLNGDMVLGLDHGEIRAAMILDQNYNEGYDQVEWTNDFEEDELMMLHILAVAPKYSRRGIGKAMVRHAIETARKEGRKAIRLDVLKGNVPAERLYPSQGFRFQAELPMYYEDTGWMIFEVYERIV